MSGNATYGFVLFYDLLSAVAAKQFMDGENIHGNNIRVCIIILVNKSGQQWLFQTHDVIIHVVPVDTTCHIHVSLMWPYPPGKQGPF